MPKISYVRLYADPQGESHFADEEMELHPRDFAPPAVPINVSGFIPARHFVVIRGDNWFGDWHPTPYRQYFFILRGEVGVEVSDGEKRRFKPGDILLVEDASGKGHVTRFFGDVLVTAVQLG